MITLYGVLLGNGKMINTMSDVGAREGVGEETTGKRAKGA